MGRTAGARPPADHPKVDATRERRGQWDSISAPAASPAAKRLRLNLASCEPNRAYPCRGLRTDAADFDAKAPQHPRRSAAADAHSSPNGGRTRARSRGTA